MMQRSLTLPTLGLIAGTRVALGLGIGLLLADRLSRDQRQAAGWALLGLGALSTVPLAVEVLGQGQPSGEGALHVHRNRISPYVTNS